MDSMRIPIDKKEAMDDKSDVLPSSPLPDSLASGEVLLHVKQEAGATPLCAQFRVEKEQPNAQLYHLLPSSSETCTGYEATPSATSLSKTPDSLKPPRVSAAPDGDGLETFLPSLPS